MIIFNTINAQKIIESAAISNFKNKKQAPGFYNISSYLVKMVLQQNKVSVDIE